MGALGNGYDKLRMENGTSDSVGGTVADNGNGQIEIIIENNLANISSSSTANESELSQVRIIYLFHMNGNILLVQL